MGIGVGKIDGKRLGVPLGRKLGGTEGRCVGKEEGAPLGRLVGELLLGATDG